MTTSMILNIIIVILAIVGGFILALFILSGPTESGELVIDTTDEAKDRWLIKLNEPTEKTARRGVVVLRVVNRPIVEDDRWPNER